MKLNGKLLALLLSAGALASGCAPSAGKEEAPKLIGTYMNGEVADFTPMPSVTGKVARIQQVNIFENNLYQLVQTEVNYAFSTCLGTTSIVTYGTYTAGPVEDGVAKYSLNVAKEVLFNSYSQMGGYHISINTQSAEYPVEMLAQTQGEQNMAQSKQDVIDEYGAGFVIYASGNTFSFLKDGEGTKEAVTTASGSVDKLLTKEIKSSNLIGTITTNIGYGEGSWKGEVYQVNVFSDNKYETFKTELSFGFSQVLGFDTILTYGESTLGTDMDGWAPLTVKRANRVIMNFFSGAGGSSLHIDTDDCEYPAEMMAAQQGEQNMAESKDDVINEYGQEVVVYIPTSTEAINNELSLTDPNAD